MIFSTKGIVLHRFKYSDSQTIVKVYTKKFGLQSYLVYGASSKKARQTLSILQPLFLVDMQVYHNEKRDLQKLKEISNLFPFASIPFDIYKSSVSLFLAEFLMKILKENDIDEDLFSFLIEAIKTFDDKDVKHLNFHIILLFMMLSYFGIRPDNNFSLEKITFDLTSGKFIIGIPNHKDYAGVNLSLLIHKLFSIHLNNSKDFKISNNERRNLLNVIINFYTIHLGKPGKLKTLKVLQEIF